MERVPEILEAISEEDRARMRANVAKVWRRWAAVCSGRAALVCRACSWQHPV